VLQFHQNYRNEFWSRKRSFYGHKYRAGKFEAADKGTIFLDEIGDMSLSAQASITCCRKGMITRVGSDKVL
jgi:transcriptional regulator with GAF, ATPase, and Fis domain